VRKTKIITTEDVLITLCKSVSETLSKATGKKVTYSPMVQKISRTCLKPDVACFVLFDGGFNGIVVNNFTADAAIEIYQGYMKNMGMPESEISQSYMADDVANVLGELMNQCVGGFTHKIKSELQTNITQSQPKMLVINKSVNISVDTVMERPQARRVSFSTSDSNIFYLELAMDKTEFIKLHDFELEAEYDPDDIIASSQNVKKSKNKTETIADIADDDFMAELGL
jgi:chemotaxis protein CheY-P-specific phosphatase CheC